MSNLDKHAAVLEGIEKMSYYLVWSKIEESNLAIPYKAHAQLESDFVQLYTIMLKFMARCIRFLRNKPRQSVHIQLLYLAALTLIKTVLLPPSSLRPRNLMMISSK